MKTTKMLMILVFALALIASVANADFTFGEPTNLGPTINTSSGDAPSCFSSDGLELYFTSDRPGGYGDWDIWVARRPTIDDEWGTPMNLGPPVNTGREDACACISGDGLSLFFHSDRPGGLGDPDLYVTTRETISDDWGTPVNLGPPVNTSGQEHAPRLSTDGLELYFSSFRRAGGYGDADIWVTKRTKVNDPWGPPINLGSVVNSSADENIPFISANALSLFFSEDYWGPYRPGGFGDIDMWVTTRASVNDPWEIPLNLGPIVNSASVDAAPLISPDGSMLYFCSERPGGFGGLWGDIYQAPIIPIVDFNGDGIVDIKDLLILIEYWGQDESSVDIGPTPFGDGIVDVQDLEVLMSYWGQEFEFLPFDLLAYWKLDEAKGVIAQDSIGENNGACHGEPLWQPTGGRINGALAFDGIDDYVSTPFILDPADAVFSVFAWVKGGAPGQVIIAQTGGANWLWADPSEGKLRTSLLCPGGGRTAPQPLISEFIITDGEWHRVGFVWDGAYRTLYVDDVEVAKDTQDGLEPATGSLYIGAGKNFEPGSFFSGLIDDVRIYNRAITP